MAHVNRARELAMASGPGALQFSSLQLDDALARRIYLEGGLEDALERDFRLVYHRSSICSPVSSSVPRRCSAGGTQISGPSHRRSSCRFWSLPV
jgi:hypothetical protein